MDIRMLIEQIEKEIELADVQAKSTWDRKTGKFVAGPLETNERMAGYRDGLKTALALINKTK